MRNGSRCSRERSLDEKGKPLPGVRVSVSGHKEFGYTFSRSDGYYDFARQRRISPAARFRPRGASLRPKRAVTPRVQRHHFINEVGLVLANSGKLEGFC